MSADEKVGLSSRCRWQRREFPIDFFSTTFVSFDAVQCVADREMFLFSTLKGFISHVHTFLSAIISQKVYFFSAFLDKVKEHFNLVNATTTTNQILKHGNLLVVL